MDINEFVSGEHLIWNLLIALLLGAIVGTQRGWVMRNSVEGSRVAGIRTFSLVGLLGGLVGILANIYTPLLIGFALIALVILTCIAFVIQQKKSGDVSITGVVSIMVVFVLGNLTVSGEAVLAAAAAVITAVVLDNKRELHQAHEGQSPTSGAGALQNEECSLDVAPIVQLRHVRRHLWRPLGFFEEQTMSDGGKGDKQRPTNHAAFSANYDKIFGNKHERSGTMLVQSTGEPNGTAPNLSCNSSQRRDSSCQGKCSLSGTDSCGDVHLRGSCCDSGRPCGMSDQGHCSRKPEVARPD